MCGDMDKEHPVIPKRYTRKYGDDDTDVAVEDLRTAYRVAARLVTDHGEQYLPLFERLDHEIQAHEKRQEMKARALQVSKRKPKGRSGP